MKIIIKKQTENCIEFFVEREIGMYNNCNLTATLQPYEIEGLTQSQIYQLAWDRVKYTAYRVFNEIVPLNESENPIGFIFEPLPIPPEPEPVIINEPVDEEKAFLAEAVIQLSNEIETLKQEIQSMKGAI